MGSKPWILMFTATALGVLSMLSTTAAETPNAAISDIQLGQMGSLNGQIVDRQGQPQANSTVTLLQGDREIAQSTTNNEGKFAIDHLNTGLYQLEAAGQTSGHRLWAAEVAPPAAHRGVLIVSGPPAIRGRLGGRLGGLRGIGKMALFAASGYYVVDKYILDDKKPRS